MDPDLLLGAIKLGTPNPDFISGDDDEQGLYIGAPFVDSWLLTEEQTVFGLANDDTLIGDMLFAKFIARGEDRSFDRSESVIALGGTEVVVDNPTKEFESLIEGNDIFIGNDHIFAGAGDDMGAGDVYYVDAPDQTYNSFSEMSDGGLGVVLAAIAGSLDGTATVSAEALAGEGEAALAAIVGNGNVSNFSSFSDNYVEFGDDLIVAGKGDDTFAGDAWKFLLAAKGADASLNLSAISLASATDDGEAEAGAEVGLEILAQAEAVANLVQFGDDLLLGGKGNDILSGDNISTTILSKAGDATTILNSNASSNAGEEGDGGAAHALNGAFATTSSEAAVLDNWMVFGNDLLKGGLGDDKLTGDSVDMKVAVKGGAAAATVNNEASAKADDADSEATAFSDALPIALAVSGINSNHWLFGDDFLNGGIGSDQLVGDVYDLEHIIMGGDASSTANNAATIEDSGGTASAEAFITFQPTQSSTADARALFESNEFVFGDDTLKGGLGPDLMIGDVAIFSVKAAGGEEDVEFNESKSASGSGDLNVQASSDLGSVSDAVITDNTWTFGDDYFLGGHGNDVIIGDVKEFIFDIGDGVDASGNKLIFGNDWINGGKGDDILVGDAKDLSAFAGEDKTSGEVVFGQDVFVFDEGFGLDGILDFQLGFDLLDFTAFAGHNLTFDNLKANASDTADGVFIDVGKAIGGPAGTHAVTLWDLQVADLPDDWSTLGILGAL